MNVEVRLFAMLRDYLPPGGDRTGVQIETPDGASIADVISKLGIPARLAHLVLLDGRHVPDRRRRLKDGCVLSIWPPIAGG